MNKLTDGGVDASEYYANERQLANHSPYNPGEVPPPGYGMQMVTPAANVVPGVLVMGEQPWVWTWCNLITAIVAFFLCPCCGFIGTILSVLAYTDHKAQHYNSAKSKKSVALCCGITGIVISAIVFVVIIALLATGIAFAEKEVSQGMRNNGFN